MKYLQWVWISLLMSGCCIREPKKPMIELHPYQLNIPEIKSETDYLGRIEIQDVLSEGFVQGKDNQEYLYRNADGTASDAGANFLDARCTPDADNLIVYGHSSRTSEILFTPLMNYLNHEFSQKHHQLILFYHHEVRVYELISVFLFHTKQASDNDWMTVKYEREFLMKKAVERLKERSLFDFEEREGTQLLTLVTCNTENHDERLIVIGIRKENSL